MVFKHDTLTYRDPTGKRPKQRIPTLTALEQRMHTSMTRALRDFIPAYFKKDFRLTKTWLKHRSKHRATLLICRGRYQPLSDDVTITFETKVVDL